MANADPFVTQGYVVGSQSFALSIGGNVQAGGFAGTWNAQAITFWCIELTQYFGFGNTYTDYTKVAPDDALLTLLGQLFSEAYGMATMDADHSAAFQLAIWEIAYDPANLDLGAGAFRVLSGNPFAVSIAQGWLTNLGNYTAIPNLVLLHSGEHQDFVTFVPEPAPVALLAIALLAMIVVMRRRASTSNVK